MDSSTTGWSEIISAAAASPLGITALVVLVLGVLATRLFPPSDTAKVRLTVFSIVVVAFIAIALGALYNAHPIVAPATSPVAINDSANAKPGSASPPDSASPAVAIGSTAFTEIRPNPLPTGAGLVARADCGQNWTDWVEIGGAVGSPCGTCSRGEELGQKYRLTGFPPRPQTEHKFQCWR